MSSSSSVECHLCPRNCMLDEGGRGNCRVRVNRGGRLVSLVYGKPVAIHIDPVEKKPMFHFLPGTQTFSLATAGCNLHCLNCQNWQISQLNPEDADAEDWPVDKIIAATKQHACRSISSTYTEPIIFYEYAVDIATAARRENLKNIWVTAGYIEQEPLIEACRVLDGANVDIKAFSDAFYKRICSAHLQPVLDAIETMHRLGVWVEITNLVIPGENDDMGMIRDMCKWIIEKCGDTTPLHFSRFHPMYKMAERLPTPAATLFKAAETATAAGIKHVYVGNLAAGDYEHTWCPSCHKKVIERQGFDIVSIKVDVTGRCGFCGASISGVWR